MINQDIHPEGIVPSPDTTCSLQTGSCELSSEQARQTLRWLAEEGGRDRLLVTVRDITERKEAEKALHDAQNRLSQIIKATSVRR